MKSIEHYLSRAITTDSGCMEWQGALTTCGYPVVSRGGNSNVRLTRVIFEHFHHELGILVVRHLCDNPKCINPCHLVSGTTYDNIRDRHTRGRTYNQFPDQYTTMCIDLKEHGFKYKEISHMMGIKIKQVDYLLNNKAKR